MSVQLDLFAPAQPERSGPAAAKDPDWGTRWWLHQMLPYGVAEVWAEVAGMGEAQRAWYGAAQLRTRADQVGTMVVQKSDGTPRVDYTGQPRREPNRYVGISEALMWRFKQDGKTGAEFARLCRSLAVLAHQPGGVEAFGWRWDSTRGRVPVEVGS